MTGQATVLVDSGRQTPLAGRALAGLLALLALAAALALAAHHPLSAPLAMASVLLAAGLAGVWPPACLVALPALLPWLGLAPWTGWITVEETDLLVLALAAGAYARWALRPQPVAAGGAGLAGLVGALLFGLWLTSVGISLWRGVADAGGLVLDWYQAYRGPMNALRLAKSTLAVALLLPLWWRALRTVGALAGDRLTLGFALAHAGIALACLWERAAFPGLLNFSTDYRSTGLFWEMHVGGAALDGLLALSMPFALLAWLGARTRLGWALASATVLLGAYAGLTTFSRILLLALPLGLGLTLLLRWRQMAQAQPGLQDAGAAPGAAAPPVAGPDHQPDHGHTQRAAPLLAALALWAVASAAAWLMFPTSGYRGALALLGNLALLLALAPAAHGLRGREWAAGLALALAAGPLLIAAAMQLPKGPYLLQPLLWITVGLMLWRARLRVGVPTDGPAGNTWVALALAGWLVALAGMVLVAQHWGDSPALVPAVVAAGALALVLLVTALRRPAPWPAAVRWQGGVWLTVVVSAAVISVFSGGAYMSDRMSTSASDRNDRWQHWRSVLAGLPNGQAWWLGQGLGRMVDVYALNADPGNRPADLRLVESDGRLVMRLAQGTQNNGWAELLRLSQRIARPLQQPVTLQITLRNPTLARLRGEICLKHLLYSGACQLSDFSAKPSAGAWQTVRVVLEEAPLPADDGALPRFTVFTIAVQDSRQPVEVQALSLTDGQGREYLHNGGFEQGGQRWFHTSDHHHLPWHAKNLVVHLLFEQGVLGVAALGLLTAWGLWRASLGGARRHALAPALAGALLGVWVVGAVDSLLDMPRLALLMLWLTAIAASLAGPATAAALSTPRSRA